MKKIFTIIALLLASTAMAQNKVVVVPLIGGDGPAASVPKTGATSINAYILKSGEDGDLKKGVAWPGTRFVAPGDGTVTDKLTGLIWLQNANCSGVARYWETALTDVTNLNTDGTMNGNNCGDTSKGGSHQTDWRLSNVRELYSLVDLSQVRPAIPASHPFVDLETEGNYWSSTTKVDETNLAWDVSMKNGNVSAKRDKTTEGDRIFVWPVRGGN